MTKSILLNINEASTFLNVKKSWLRSAIFYKTIPFLKIGGLIRFDPSELNTWIKSNKVGATQCK